MKRVAVLLGALLALAHPAGAQDSTTAVLRRARQLYETLNVERAVPLLRQLLSPEWPFVVTTAQRSEAYKYLGAALVLVGKPDSAVLTFQAALARDPFTDLNPSEFTPAQVAAFGAARRRRLALAMRPLAETRIDARTRRVAFTLVTTHTADLRVLVRAADGSVAFPIFVGESDGLREVTWDGLTPAGGLAPPGRYELVVTGKSRLLGQADSTRLFFDVTHKMQVLEDTLPAVPRDSLLPEREPGASGVRDLAKGLGVAAGVVLLSRGLAHAELGAGQSGAVALVSLGGAATGVVAWLSSARHGEIPANIAVNRRLQADRRAANDAIRRRNADKIAHAIFVITPAAGVAR